MVPLPPVLRRRHVVLCCLAALLCGASSAHAGEVHVSDCCASFVAADNESNHIWLKQVQNGTDDWTASFYENIGDAGITAGDGCAFAAPSWNCRSISAVVGAELKDGDDSIGPLPGSTVPGVLVAFGGPGDDDISYFNGDLEGGPGNDRLQLTRAAPFGDDRLRGNEGDDTFVALQGAAQAFGDAGSDTVTFAGTAAGVRITLDDVADDGTPGQGANVHSDVENMVGSMGPDLLVGNAAANGLDGQEGADELIGGPGPDSFAGGDGDDVIDARDGAPDRISCGNGTDRATVDPADAVAGDCEQVLLPDDDGDGVTAPADCDDANAAIHPGARDVPNDGIDEDCVGGDAVAVVDADGDGASSATDCDDHDPSRYPGARDLPGDKKDEDCDGRDAPFPGLSAGVFLTTVGVKHHKTKILRLSAAGLKGGETIGVACHGRGCPHRFRLVRHVKRPARSLKLTGRLKGARLVPGARLTITVSRPGYVAKIFRYTMVRKSTVAPRRTVRCRPPGGPARRC